MIVSGSVSETDSGCKIGAMNVAECVRDQGKDCPRILNAKGMI